jgi:4'-phosphopantetheinyl transferase
MNIWRLWVCFLEVAASKILEAGTIFLTEIYFLPLHKPQSNSELSRQAHELLRFIAKQTLGTADEQFLLAKNEFGKPYLTSHPDFHFNISHTQNAITIAFSDVEIGVDIERVRESEMQIAHRFFTSNEISYIEAGDKAERFFEIWTKKEAYIKWQGKGLSIPLRSFDVLTEISAQFRTFRIGEYVLSVFAESLEKIYIRYL